MCRANEFKAHVLAIDMRQGDHAGQVGIACLNLFPVSDTVEE